MVLARWIVAIAATVAAVVYLVHTLNKLVRKADEILALPTAYKQLALSVESLHDSIDELAVQVAHLTDVERRRGRR